MMEGNMQQAVRQPEVVFLAAPYVFPPRPSLALSIFKAALTTEGMSSVVLYPMFRMIRLMGAELCRALFDIKSMTMYEEFIFAYLTGVGRLRSVEEYVAAASERDRSLDPAASILWPARPMTTASVFPIPLRLPILPPQTAVTLPASENKNILLSDIMQKRRPHFPDEAVSMS